MFQHSKVYIKSICVKTKWHFEIYNFDRMKTNSVSSSSLTTHTLFLQVQNIATHQHLQHLRSFLSHIHIYLRFCLLCLQHLRIELLNIAWIFLMMYDVSHSCHRWGIIVRMRYDQGIVPHLKIRRIHLLMRLQTRHILLHHSMCHELHWAT